MKKILVVLTGLIVSAAAFAGESNTITAGFGVGIGGITSNSEGTIKGPSDGPADLSFKGADILDIEGRVFLNNCNAAFLTRINASVAFFNDEETDNMFDAAVNTGVYFGAGYKFAITDKISVIPSLVIGVDTISAEKEENKTTTSLDYQSFAAGADLSVLFKLSDKTHLELSAMSAVTAAATGELSHKTDHTKTTYDIEGDAGKITTSARIALVWLF